MCFKFAFNVDSIVYDNTPWRPGRELDINNQPVSEEDERKLKQNLATRILSNGVEVLVKEKSTERRPEQRRNKLIELSATPQIYINPAMPKRSLLSSAVATVVNHQHLSAIFPLHQLMQHNYIIKTCLTTYTYLTTIVEDKRSAVSTFETIVSVVTTESLTNLFASDLLPDIRPTKTNYMEVKTIQPSSPSHSHFQSSIFPKIDKRVDSEVENDNFELIQSSEVNHAPCTSSCSCSQSQTEHLDRFKTKFANKIDPTISQLKRIPLKTIKYGPTKVEQVKPTRKESLDQNNQPYEYEAKITPTDKIVEKYTEVISDYSEEKDTIEETELLTNEQAPGVPKPDKDISQKHPDKAKPEKPNKPINNKNKFVVADLIKLGSLGMKGLSQLAPVLEKMTGSFMKRQDVNKNASTTTIKPQVTTLTSYSANKRIDSDIDNKHSNFPIYIPVDELETSESQYYFKNATLHQNYPWATDYKHPKAHIIPPRMIHESPLVNGGIPISPGEIITANSDVIVGKPAVGGPLTLTASGIKLQNAVNPPPIDIDSYVSSSEQFMVQEKPPATKSPNTHTQTDDSYDLRPPELPKHKPPNRNLSRPPIQPPKSHIMPPFINNNMNKAPMRPGTLQGNNDHLMKTEQIKTASMLSNHGTPVFLDYIPSLGKPLTQNNENKYKEKEISDSMTSSSDIVHNQFDSGFSLPGQMNDSPGKPFLVDIQPSRVANVLIPHGSSTTLVFAGSSEPHKTGDYVDDPLPYSEPGYFGSFSIDAPQMTNVHNVAPTNNKPYAVKPSKPSFKPPPKEHHMYVNDLKQKRKEPRRPIADYDKIPPPTSNQETHFQVGPHITAYNPDIYNPSNGDFDNVHKIKDKDPKGVIDKEYENFLAVPPPPPKKHHNGGTTYDNSRPYSQRPIVHTKPIQDMKVFLNIQHPVSKPVTPLIQEQSPPKITSEIYFASQAPEKNQDTPVYTVHLPANHDHRDTVKYHESKPAFSGSSETDPNAFTVSTSVNNYANINNRPQYINEVPDKDSMYTVTLNTATNVANGYSQSGQVVGSSIPVDIGTPPNNFGPNNANIPIGTNFAIKVEDDSSPFESSNVQHGHLSQETHNKPNNVSFTVQTTDNRWNISTIDDDRDKLNAVPDKKVKSHNKNQKYNVPLNIQSINSHANFPMINSVTDSTTKLDVRPVTEVYQEERRPVKTMPHSPTNSHGWYSHIPIKDLNLNNFDNINNIKVESSTRKIIPLIHDYSNQKTPNFGQKLSTVGKPPSEFWDQKPAVNIQTVGKPFSKPITESPSFSQLTTKPYDSNFIVANIGTIQQPVYDIPIREDSDIYTTTFTKPSSGFVKPVYENAEEIYDGQDSNESNDSGEVSQESMSVPIVSTSQTRKDKPKLPPSEISLLQDEIFEPYPNRNKDKVELVEFNPDTQTEKPFIADKYNRTNTFQSNTIKPIDTNKYYNMKPRPFTVNTVTTLDHQLQQPHWQINQLWENTTNLSSDESIELNMGEEMSTVSVKPVTTKKPNNKYDIKYKKPQRPVFSVKQNTTFTFNDSIITSTVHITDKKPLTVLDEGHKGSTLASFTIPSTDFDDKVSSEIIDLSPPPPTLDYNFKPTNNDETIMGMSPPPPRTPVVPIRSPMPARSTPTPRPYRTKPPRTLPPRLPLPRPTRKPIKDRDEISTYRPSYDILKNNLRRPGFNRDQPSSQLLPPPQETSTYKIEEVSPSVLPSVPDVIFPTPTSSGWLTSSGIGFSSSFDFGPTPIHFPEVSLSSQPPLPQPSASTEKLDVDPETSSENSYSSSTNNYKNVYYHHTTTNKYVDGDFTSINKQGDNHITTPKYTKETSFAPSYTEKGPTTPKDENIDLLESYVNSSQETSTEISSTENSSTENDSQSQEANVSTEKIKINVLRNKDRTRKPYQPIRESSKNSNLNRYQPSIRATPIIKPTKTLSRSEILYPTKQTSIRKIRPIPTRSPTIRPSIIESSETHIEDEYIKPTEVLKSDIPSVSSSVELENKPSIIQNNFENSPSVKPTHHAGNEVKVYDEIMPTKTEFKTTVVTLTKTLLEPPKTISSIGYVNLTHTLTVTHTKTSLISQANGAVTQTLILTNTQTSTIVDVVTKVQTEVQPTTIIETVTKHIPIVQVEPTPVIQAPGKTKIALDDITMSSEEDNLVIQDSLTTENIQKIDKEEDSDTFFVVMNKSQNGGSVPPVTTDIETDYDDITRNEQVNNNGVSQVLFGEILLAGTPYLETTNIANPNAGFSKECQPDCKASRNERCQRIDGMMKCVCRPGFARMFPDRPCKPTYTYSVKLALSSKGKENLKFHSNLGDNSTKEYNNLALATHEGINRMVMQSDLRDVYHGVHISGFQPVEMRNGTGNIYQGVINEFYVQLSDNAHESRLKEVIEKYLRNNNYSLGGTDVYASSELINNLHVSDFDECKSGQFHDCSEHAQCFNLRGTYTCSCLEGFADLSVNNLYPGRICSAEPVGCELCNYHGACYSRDDRRVLCECFQWYAGNTCQVNLKVVLISMVTVGALLTVVLVICAVIACSKRPRPPQRSIVTCIQGIPGLHQGAVPKQRADRRALINERAESGDASSIQNASLPYMPPSKKSSAGVLKKCVISEPPNHDPPPPPAPAVMIPRARLHPHRDSKEHVSRKQSLELSSEDKLISYLESGTNNNEEMMRRKHSMESSYSAHRERHSKQGALVSAGFKVSTTVRADESMMKEEPDDGSINKRQLEEELERYDSLRKTYSHEELSEWTDAERRIGELTLSEARSVGGTLPASTGRAASSTRMTHQEANTMAERDLGSTFLLPHVHLYKPNVTSDVSDFDSL